MTWETFSRLLPAERVRVALTQGTFLARRGQAAGGFRLYHVPTAGPGFFVELSFEPALGALVIVRSFVETKYLLEYVHAIRLPRLL